MKINTINIKDGVKLHYINTGKFKTTTLGIYIHMPLSKEHATKNALLSMVLRRGCPMYPTTRSLATAMDNLYGAEFETNIRKKGDSHVISANFQFANEKFIKSNEPILKNILQIAKSMVLEQTGFNEDFVKQEKENLKREILSQKNDKRSYALQRCIEEMCKDEPYGIARLGVLQDVDVISAEDLYNHYKENVLSSPFDIFIVGEVDIASVEKDIKDMFADINITHTSYPKSTIIKTVNEIRNITETEKIVQGKISMGFRTKIEAEDTKYPALMMYNAVLGNGTFSKLFNNVREKLSLAYYASSSVDYLKGIMTINSGIEVKNFKMCYDEILAQMEEMRKGNITDQEFGGAKLGTINTIKSLTDNAFLVEDYYLTRLIIGDILEIDSLVDMVNSVEISQIVDISKSVELDTVYFLKGSEE